MTSASSIPTSGDELVYLQTDAPLRDRPAEGRQSVSPSDGSVSLTLDPSADLAVGTRSYAFQSILTARHSLAGPRGQHYHPNVDAVAPAPNRPPGTNTSG